MKSVKVLVNARLLSEASPLRGMVIRRGASRADKAAVAVYTIDSGDASRSGKCKTAKTRFNGGEYYSFLLEVGRHEVTISRDAAAILQPHSWQWQGANSNLVSRDDSTSHQSLHCMKERQYCPDCYSSIDLTRKFISPPLQQS